jgi:hypothetical protein
MLSLNASLTQPHVICLKSMSVCNHAPGSPRPITLPCQLGNRINFTWHCLLSPPPSSQLNSPLHRQATDGLKFPRTDGFASIHQCRFYHYWLHIFFLYVAGLVTCILGSLPNNRLRAHRVRFSSPALLSTLYKTPQLLKSVFEIIKTDRKIGSKMHSAPYDKVSTKNANTSNAPAAPENRTRTGISRSPTSYTPPVGPQK